MSDSESHAGPAQPLAQIRSLVAANHDLPDPPNPHSFRVPEPRNTARCHHRALGIGPAPRLNEPLFTFRVVERFQQQIGRREHTRNSGAVQPVAVQHEPDRRVDLPQSCGQRLHLRLPEIIEEIVLPVEVGLLDEIEVGQNETADPGPNEADRGVAAEAAAPGDADGALSKDLRRPRDIAVKDAHYLPHSNVTTAINRRSHRLPRSAPCRSVLLERRSDSHQLGLGGAAGSGRP